MSLDYPIRKTSINLYEQDCLAMERLYGRGWTETIREMVHEHVKKKHLGYFAQPPLSGDD
jgi:hypothetical protein